MNHHFLEKRKEKKQRTKREENLFLFFLGSCTFFFYIVCVRGVLSVKQFIIQGILTSVSDSFDNLPACINLQFPEERIRALLKRTLFFNTEGKQYLPDSEVFFCGGRTRSLSILFDCSNKVIQDILINNMKKRKLTKFFFNQKIKNRFSILLSVQIN